MAGSDINRAYQLKRLFDEQLKKVDPKKNDKERREDAAKLMDRILGTEWRGEAALPEVEIIDIDIATGPTAKDPNSFHHRVHDAMVGEGLDFPDDEPNNTAEELEKRDGSTRKDQLLCGIKKLLDQLM